MRCSLLLLLAIPLLPSVEGVRVQAFGQHRLLISAPASEGLDRESRNRMSLPMAFDAREIPVAEACDRIARATGLTIVVDPALRADFRPVTLTVERMQAGTVLDWVCRMADVRWEARAGGIWVTAAAQNADLPRRTVMIDVTDLVTPIRDFPGPELALTAGRNGVGDLFTPLPGEGSTVVGDIDDVARLLEQTLNNGR